jgi:hypothetical protein
VIVAQGTYVENVRLKGKNIIVRNTDPSDPEAVKGTIIDGSRSDSVVTFSGTEKASCVLAGFTIRNGKADYGGRICTCMGTIENCIFRASRGVGARNKVDTASPQLTGRPPDPETLLEEGCRAPPPSFQHLGTPFGPHVQKSVAQKRTGRTLVRENDTSSSFDPAQSLWKACSPSLVQHGLDSPILVFIVRVLRYTWPALPQPHGFDAEVISL